MCIGISCGVPSVKARDNLKGVLSLVYEKCIKSTNTIQVNMTRKLGELEVELRLVLNVEYY